MLLSMFDYIYGLTFLCLKIPMAKIIKYAKKE